MDILAALKAEESKLQQQLDTVHEAIKIVIRESKPPDDGTAHRPIRCLSTK